MRKSIRIPLRILLFLGQAALIVFVSLVLAAGFEARRGTDLDWWHTEELTQEYSHRDPDPDLGSYLAREQRLFSELQDMMAHHAPSLQGEQLSRYVPGNRSDPSRNGHNANRSQVLIPEQPRGAALLLHGMTDSPYSLAHFAVALHERGYYVINLRVPGHGTLPSELANIDWKDWASAVRLAVREVQQHLEPQQPFLLMGYSNGAALALDYTLDSLGDPEWRTPDEIILLSPMLGVSGLAQFGKILFWLGQIDFFEKSQWLNVIPEYDPHKYNSFPSNAPRQSLAITAMVDSKMSRLADPALAALMPPVLTFQSLVDSTVQTRAVYTRLFQRLPENGSELVLFDVNRVGMMDSFIQPATNRLLEQMSADQTRDWRLTRVENRSEDSNRVRLRSMMPHQSEPEFNDLPYRWPDDFYSLTHVALPFPPWDEVYGYAAAPSPDGFPALGQVRMVGESGALTLPASLFTRARSNPFFDYVMERVLEKAAED